MHMSLFGFYIYPYAKGFYVFKVGDERFDSSLLGVHWSVEIGEEEEQEYRILSFDILFATLIRNTFISMFKRKTADEDKER